MARLIIKNVGPIKKADFDLNKVNVFMGPQSSGKSTIAKICSQFTWCEKNYLLSGEEYNFYKGLLDFHRMDKGYFSDASEMKYESEWVTISFKGRKKETLFTKKESKIRYTNLKIEYIPAERNFVAAIPKLEKYSESFDNVINFRDDWMSFRETITKKSKFPIPLKTIDVQYKYDSSTKEDIITLANNKSILLQKASSGQQSIIPLLVVSEYMFSALYSQKRNISPVEKKYISGLLPENMKSEYEWVINSQNFPEKSGNGGNGKLLEETKEKIWNKIGLSADYRFSNVIIEEPEQNLFPETQKELVYSLLKSINDKGRNHKLLLTTHSPYILYALNNCMMGGLVKNKISKNEQSDFESNASWIAPDLVSVWEIVKGTLKQIKNNKTGTVSKHYFNGIMNEVMEEYYDLLTYLNTGKDEE